MTDVKMKLHLCKEPDKFQFVEQIQVRTSIRHNPVCALCEA